jgi:hypothetical protein
MNIHDHDVYHIIKNRLNHNILNIKTYGGTKTE